MKYKLAGLAISALLFSLNLIAQTKDEKDVATAVETLRQAMIDGNKQALENILADQLSYGHSGGKVDTKISFIEDLATGKSDFVTILLADQTIKFSDNVALVRHKLTGETLDNGKTNAINLNVLLVWQKQKGQWKLIARHAARINP